MSETTNALEVRGVHAGYNKRVDVLRGVDLTVGPGHAVGVTGLNGAGKSTLMKVISGQLKPHSGSITFHGEDTTGHPSDRTSRNGMAFLPEGHMVLKSLTVKENLLLATGALTNRGAAAKLRSHLELIHELFPILESRESQLAGLLSGGEQQMLSLSRAIVREPRLLLLDEPSLGLAPVVVAKIYEAIGSLRERGVSVLVVEQSGTRLRTLCDELVVLRKGQVVANGRVDELSHEEVQRAYF
ncbi:MAG: ABC transporter ATP-binding protein [Nocardioides sp.]